MNLRMPSSAQQKVYLAIAGYFAETGYAPSYEAIGKICGLSSLATIFKHVHNLEKLGMLKLRKGKIQGISAKVCPACGHRKTAGKCDDPEVHTDFIATFKEMCERGKRIEQLEKKLAETRA